MNRRADRIAKRGGAAEALARIADVSRRALAAAVGSALPIAGACAQTKSDFAQAAKGVVQALDLQTAFPNETTLVPSARWPLSEDLARLLLWTAVAVGAVVVALYLRDILPGGGLARRKRWSADPADPRQTGAGAEAQAQTDADELARLGRFVEAMHVLLLQALADMRGRLDVAIADSLTSREILRRAPVSPVAKSALQDIVGAVERAYFGDHPAGEGDYLACRANFAAFVGALRGGARA